MNCQWIVYSYTTRAQFVSCLSPYIQVDFLEKSFFCSLYIYFHQTQPRLYKYLTMYKVQTCYRLLRRLEIHRFSKIVNFDKALIISIFFSSFCTYLWEIGRTHNLKNISKVHVSSYFYGVGKECLCQILLSFSKMKLLLWHHYRVIHRYEHLRCST